MSQNDQNQQRRTAWTDDELKRMRRVLVMHAKYNGCGASASDIAQSALCATLGRPESQHTFAYLYTVLKNKIADRFRRRGREQVFPTHEMPIVDNRDGRSMLDKLIAKSENAALIDAMIQKLNEREWAIFWLRYFQDVPRAEICNILKITEGQYGNSIRQLHRKAELSAIELGIVTATEKDAANNDQRDE